MYICDLMANFQKVVKFEHDFFEGREIAIVDGL